MSSKAWQIGSSVAGYRLERVLGAGGMGVVFGARHAETGAQRAIKTVTALADEETQARLLREGEALARLQHPSLLQVHSAGAHAGQTYLVLEFAPGGSLADHLRRGPLSVDHALEVFGMLAQALSAAHAAGVVHRDIKPGNVLFDADGTPKLADFGLASLHDRSRMTETGTLMGSPLYMAPEQACGDRAAAPADVHSLGATLYHALAGRPPIEAAGSALATLARIQDEVPPRLGKSDGVPPALAALVESTLAKRPDVRPSAQQVADTLCGKLEAKRRSRTPLAAALTALILLGLAVALAGTTGEQAPSAAGASPNLGLLGSPLKRSAQPRPEASPVPRGEVMRLAQEEACEALGDPQLFDSATQAARLPTQALVNTAGDRRLGDGARAHVTSTVAMLALGQQGYVSWQLAALSVSPLDRLTHSAKRRFLVLAASQSNRRALQLLAQDAEFARREGVRGSLLLLSQSPIRLPRETLGPALQIFWAQPEWGEPRGEHWRAARRAYESGLHDSCRFYLLALAKGEGSQERWRITSELRYAATLLRQRWQLDQHPRDQTTPGSVPPQLIEDFKSELPHWSPLHYDAGRAATDDGRFEDALHSLNRACQLNPEFLAAISGASKLLRCMGDLAASRQRLDVFHYAPEPTSSRLSHFAEGLKELAHVDPLYGSQAREARKALNAFTRIQKRSRSR